MSATTTRFVKVAVGDVVIPTNREEHAVLAVAGTRLLLRDRTATAGSSTAGALTPANGRTADSPPRSARCPRWGGPPGSVPSEHDATIAGRSRRTGHEQAAHPIRRVEVLLGEPHHSPAVTLRRAC